MRSNNKDGDYAGNDDVSEDDDSDYDCNYDDDAGDDYAEDNGPEQGADRGMLKMLHYRPLGRPLQTAGGDGGDNERF